MKQRLQFCIQIRYVFHFVIRFKLLADFCNNHKKYVVNLRDIFLGFNVFLMLFLTAVKFTSVIDVFLGIEMADAGTHRIKIANICRFCGKTASSKKTSARPKEKFKLEFERHGVNVGNDNDFIHPPNVCLTCVGYCYRF